MKSPKLLFAFVCLGLLAAGCTTTDQRTSASSTAAKQASLDASVDSALEKLYAQVSGSRELVRKSRGVLVFPGIVSAGLVIGASYGQGELRKGASTAGNYASAAGSVGLLAGAESKAIYVLFMTSESLANFEASKGWTAGVDASVTLVTVGADGQLNSQTIQQPVVGFALVNGGLMANLSIEGTKFTKIDL